MKYHVLNFSKGFTKHYLVKVFSSLSGAKNFVLRHNDDYYRLSIYCYDSNFLYSHCYIFDKSTCEFHKHY